MFRFLHYIPHFITHKEYIMSKKGLYRKYGHLDFYIIDIPKLILLKEYNYYIYFDGDDDNGHETLKFIDKYIKQQKQHQKLIYNFVLKEICQMANHIKLKDGNLGAKIIKLNYDLKSKQVNDVYNELINNNDMIIKYLDIRTSNELMNKVSDYICCL